MTNEVLEYLYRGIIQHLNGDKELSHKYINKAAKTLKVCSCGGRTVEIRYGGQASTLCTSCGIIKVRGRSVKKCLVNSRRIS